MPDQTVTPVQEPILELWRILALAMVVAAGMLFVHLIVPAEAETSGPSASAVGAVR